MASPIPRGSPVPSTPIAHPALPPSLAGAAVPPAEPRPLALFGLEFSLRTASLDALEVVSRAVGRSEVETWFDRFSGTQEAALLTTCHRTELLLLVRHREEVERWREVLPGDRRSWSLRERREAVRHLFRVAAGRESLALGEAEARHQVRAAASGVVSRYPRPVLRTVFHAAASAADTVAPSVPPARSIGSIASRRLLSLVARPWPHVLVVGSGTVGRQVTSSLAPSARVTVVYHHRPPEEEFLRTLGVQAVPLERLPEELPGADAVVTAAKFGNRGLRAADIPRGRPMVLVDLGVPRNIDPDVRSLPLVRLIDLEELGRMAEGDPDVGVDERLVVLAEETCLRLERELREPWVAGFRRSAEELRRDELARARPFLGSLTPDQRDAVEILTRRLVTRLLKGPTERVRSLPPGPEGDARRRWASELLGSHATGP